MATVAINGAEMQRFWPSKSGGTYPELREKCVNIRKMAEAVEGKEPTASGTIEGAEQ